jgi:cystathionine gamma-lyase
MQESTKAILTGKEPRFREGDNGDVVVPIHLSATFARQEVEKLPNGYEYSRCGNPTRDTVEKKLAAPEEARFGLAFSSGLAAETVVLLGLLKDGDHVVGLHDLYGGTIRLFESVFARRFAITTSYADASSIESIVREFRPNTKVIWLESPTNPLLKLCDIRLIAEKAHERNILVVVDNTFASPHFQKPLLLGADIVVHSTTKYINGHSDSIGGAIMLSNEALYTEFKFLQNATGSMLSPFDSYLVARGLKTMSIRMEKHQENALEIARFLDVHPKVKKVNYPGLPSHPQHELARQQMGGFGGVISFEINGGVDEAKQFLSGFKTIRLAESLGGVESIIEHPGLMSHSSLSPRQQARAGITPALIRLSVGIEDARDLLEDLRVAFEHIP